MYKMDKCLFIMDTNYRNGYMHGREDELKEIYEHIKPLVEEHVGEYQLALNDVCKYLYSRFDFED